MLQIATVAPDPVDLVSKSVGGGPQKSMIEPRLRHRPPGPDRCSLGRGPGNRHGSGVYRCFCAVLFFRGLSTERGIQPWRRWRCRVVLFDVAAAALSSLLHGQRFLWHCGTVARMDGTARLEQWETVRQARVKPVSDESRPDSGYLEDTATPTWPPAERRVPRTTWQNLHCTATLNADGQRQSDPDERRESWGTLAVDRVIGELQ
ncbi:hypothetical protein CT0861_06120 [Colletotrichum tofieldiae]|uniref:Uncharacterized protein n=1 Tax=Colletotrichum tofieldiae TaxID=708197 RepID=A0A166UV80_9PEZI|nr:hypothetical protein CT0861_06120 [Colletotrichum tofieldiae]